MSISQPICRTGDRRRDHRWQRSRRSLVYTLAGLYLFTARNTVEIVILVSGSVIVFVADHFVRPVLIGGAARCRSCGCCSAFSAGSDVRLSGLFLGPALMAALVALWREWTEAPDDRADMPRQIDTAAK
jgi:predicted PurR-regulated permease PerM